MKMTQEKDLYSQDGGLFMALALLQKEVLDTLDFQGTFQEVLNLLLQLTQSRLGFIAETAKDEQQRSCARIHAITNVAWNSKTRALYQQLEAGNFLLHAPGSLVDAAMRSRDPIVSNDPGRDVRAVGVPEGHPPLDSFLGIPLIKGGTTIGVIGLANRAGGYDDATISALDPILPICASLIHSKIQMAERKRSERTLEASEARFRALFEAISQGVIHYSMDGSILASNPAAERILGARLQQFLGLARPKPGSYMIHEDGSVAVPSEMPTATVFRVGRAVGPVVIGYVSPQEENTTWLALEAIPLFSDGENEPFQAYAVFEDITRQKEAEAALKESERRYLLAQIAGGVGIWDWHPKTEHLFWDRSCWVMLGEEPEDCILCYDDWRDRVHPDDIVRVEEEIGKDIAEDEGFSVEFRLRTANGDWSWINGRGRVVERDGDGQITRVMGTHTKIHERKLAELAFQAEHEALLSKNLELRLLAKVFTHAFEGIVIAGRDGTIVKVNEAACRISGYESHEMVGRNARMFLSGDQSDAFYAELWKSLRRNGSWSGEVWNRRKDGTKYCEAITIGAVLNQSGKTQHYVGWISDITAGKEQQRRLEFIANYDNLTGLPNRKLLGEKLSRALVDAKRHGQIVGVAYVDLDGFKEVNDSLGHDAGDTLLKVVAGRMKSCLRSNDTVARFGGDEFVVVLTSLREASGAIPMVERLLKATDIRGAFGRSESRVSASIGITFYHPSSGDEPDQLVRYADQAMYEAKLMGKNRYHVFDPVQDNALRDRHSMLRRIQTALDENEFVLYYQPKVNMRSGDVLGMEALIRWNHPEQGLLAPGSFLPGVESAPIGDKISDWVIEAALAQMSAWGKEGVRLPVSVNVSGHDLQREDFVGRLRGLLEKYPDVPAGFLSLEVLETSAIGDMEHAGSVISACAAMGVDFALDDFGTGYSSLAHLRRLPARTLKIDRSFVHDMLVDADDLMILEGVMGLASAFRRQTIAEGVETVAHGEMLLDLGCDMAQGYAIARPMPAGEVKLWVAEWRPYRAWYERTPLSSKWIPVLVAAVYHRAWMCQALDGLMGKGAGHLPAYDLCRFGTWVRDDARALLQSDEELSELSRMHRKVHELADGLIDRIGHVPGEKRQRQVDVFLRSSDQLLGYLRAVITREIYGHSEEQEIGYLNPQVSS